jgi:Uma2 family endonuclease
VTPITPTDLAQPFLKPLKGRPAWEIAYLYPFQGEWTEEEYLSIGTNHLIEFSDGCIKILPMPTIDHQRIVKVLLKLLERYVDETAVGGEVLFAPLPVKLELREYREPDLIYLGPKRLKKTHRYPFGADLVMEVVSEGKEGRDRDLVEKPKEYAKARISEYWIIDPEKHRITVLSLKGQSYRVHGEFGPGSDATSVLLRGFAVPVDQVFSAATAQ